MSAQTFIRCFKRFVARRGLPRLIVSDNGKTFKGAAKIIRRIMEHREVVQHFAGVQVQWTFNLERAPWWGGIFERMVRSTKRCLRKMIGRAKLSYEELLTVLIEVEMVINSRPISYVTSSDLEEPLTPSHLLTGRRLLSLPDNLCYSQLADPDYDPETTPEILTRRMKFLNTTLERFWKRWKREYLLELRNSHRITKKVPGNKQIAVGDVVVIHSDQEKQGFWNLGVIQEIIPGRDGEIRGAIVKQAERGRNHTLLRRPVQLLYPLEISCLTDDSEVPTTSTESVPEAQSSTESQHDPETRQDSEIRHDLNRSIPTDSTRRSLEDPTPRRSTPRRAAALARDRIVAQTLI